MIPKKIHYCWFGKGKMPDLALKCLESWKKYCPDYVIKEWNEDNFDLDLSLFPVLEKVNISYDAKISGWEMLHQLNWLQLSKVRTDNLSFLEKTISLQYLRIIGGSFTSIEGLEKCVNLKTLFLQRCTALTNLKPTIASLYNLERLNLEACRKVSVEELKGIAVRYISVI